MRSIRPRFGFKTLENPSLPQASPGTSSFYRVFLAEKPKAGGNNSQPTLNLKN